MTLYTSSGFRSTCFPLRMKLFPEVPRYAVIFLPNRMKVKISPYYATVSDLLQVSTALTVLECLLTFALHLPKNLLGS